MLGLKWRFIFSLLAGLLAAGAQADNGSSLRQAGANATIEAPHALRIDVNEAAEMVQRQTGGRILAAQSVRESGRPGYRIKVLTREGEVRIVFVDALTGTME